MRLLILIVFIALDLVFGFTVLCSDASGDNSQIDFTSLDTFTRVIQIIRQDYFEPAATSYRKLTYAGLHSMLAHLDPHSQFLEPDDLKDRETENRGQFGGFGFTISRRDQEIIIVSTMEGSPSARAGILSGDQLIAIDDRPTAGMSVEELNRRLQARPDQQVTLTIFRAATKETRKFPLHRELFKVASVVDSKILDQNQRVKIGYVRITEFTEPTAQELADRLGALEAKGMQALILDLRFNPGGLLTSAVDVSGLFVPPRTMIAYTEGRDPAQRNEYFTDLKSGHWQNVPMAILTNGSSASAAEIVTGALKDLKRAVVVGETTFGKGVVQSQIPLPDGSAMLLTTAKYYTPSRQVIQEKGITPDIKVSLDGDQERAVALRQRGGSFTSEEQELVAQAHDLQLSRASDALHGLIIYREEVK